MNQSKLGKSKENKSSTANRSILIAMPPDNHASMAAPIVSERIRNLWINKINGKYERTSQRSKRESNQIEWIRV